MVNASLHLTENGAQPPSINATVTALRFFFKVTLVRGAGRHVSKVPILLQKSFLGDRRKFLEPLMRFTRDDVRDHIGSSKIDRGPP
jgi:hypothetical protein